MIGKDAKRDPCPHRNEDHLEPEFGAIKDCVIWVSLQQDLAKKMLTSDTSLDVRWVQPGQKYPDLRYQKGNGVDEDACTASRC